MTPDDYETIMRALENAQWDLDANQEHETDAHMLSLLDADSKLNTAALAALEKYKPEE